MKDTKKFEEQLWQLLIQAKGKVNASRRAGWSNSHDKTAYALSRTIDQEYETLERIYALWSDC